MINSFFHPTYLSSFILQLLLPSFVCFLALYFFGSTVTEFVWFVHLLFFADGASVVGWIGVVASVGVCDAVVEFAEGEAVTLVTLLD